MVHIKNKQTKKPYHVLLQMEDEVRQETAFWATGSS